MRIAGRYSHKNSEQFIREKHPDVLREIEEVISSINAESCRQKRPRGAEIKRAERVGVTHFYSPFHLNALFDYYFFNRDWDIKPRIITHDEARSGFREMDFLKDKVGVEVQIGKYAFLTYDIVAKMVVFANFEIIECGVEICPMASMLPHLSTGIGAFEQVVWDLSARGEADIDVPVLVMGFEPEEPDSQSEAKTQEDQQLTLVEVPQSVESVEPEIVLNRYKDLSEGTYKKVRETGLNVYTRM